MTTPTPAADQAWGMLASATSEEREASMLRRYRELAALAEGERVNQMPAMARSEYALTDDKLRPFTLSRLRVWLKLESAVALRISASYDAVMLKMPGREAMRRVGLVQTLARDFSPEDEARLRELVPGVLGAVAPRVAIKRLQEELAQAPAAAASAKPAKKGGLWPFGKR